MATFEVTTDIKRGSAEVWDILSNVVAWPLWLPTVLKVEALDGTPLAVGARYKVTQPKLPPTIWTVSCADAGRHLEWRARSPGVILIAQHHVESVGESMTRVRLRFIFEGWLGRILGRLAAGMTREYVQQEAAFLKFRCEEAG